MKKKKKLPVAVSQSVWGIYVLRSEVLRKEQDKGHGWQK